MTLPSVLYLCLGLPGLGRCACIVLTYGAYSSYFYTNTKIALRLLT